MSFPNWPCYSVPTTGRTSFYDKYGVVNDVIQNHLSEVLYKITKELHNDDDADGSTYDEEKVMLQKKVAAIDNRNDVVYGQYKGRRQSTAVV